MCELSAQSIAAMGGIVLFDNCLILKPDLQWAIPFSLYQCVLPNSVIGFPKQE